MEINKKTLRKLFWGGVGLIAVYWLLHETDRLQSVISGAISLVSPFLVGAAIAFILNVPMRSVERLLKPIKKNGLRRGIAIVLTIALILLILVGIIYLIIPQLIVTLESLIQTIPGFFGRVQTKVTAFLNNNPDLMKWLVSNTDVENFNWQNLIEKAVSLVSGSVTTIADTVLNAVVNLSTGIFNAVLSVVFALSCLARKEILARQGRRIVYAILPEKAADETVRIMRMTSATFANFISGQLKESVILACMFAVTMLIFRMPYVLLISVIIGLTALIPIVGAFIGCAIGAFLILMQSPIMALWFVVLFLVLQQIEGNLIYPRVVGTSVGLPGMWVLFAVAVGGDLMGVGGMLLMIPLASVLYALLREITNRRLADRGIKWKKLQDQPPEKKSRYKAKRDRKKQSEFLKKALAKKHHTSQEEGSDE